jgi:two-component system chemotaxis sensor kinase CheA
MFGPEEAEKLSDEQVLGLIFLAGFSTARKVTDLSGRGVGMDVVKRAIEGMGGSLRVRSSTGRGTTVTISLPLTMDIIPAVLAEAEQSVFAIPLSAVKEVLKVEEGSLRSVGQRKVIQLRESVISMVHLREALGLNGDAAGPHVEGEPRCGP